MISKIKELWADSTNRKAITLFIGIVVPLIAFLFFQQNIIINQNEQAIADAGKAEGSEEKNMLRDELDDLIDEHNYLLDEYGELNEQLHEKDSVIQQQIAEIRNLIRTESDLNEARKKITALKDISKRYLANIDSLLTVNGVLTFEKDSVVKVNKDINWRNYRLNKQNEKLAEKVSKGSVLEVLDVGVETIRYRNTGREVSTKYANKVQKIRACFTVSANQISDAETKTVYMQIINENGELIQGNELLKTVVADSTVECTSASDFKYDNIEITHCFEWERVQVLLPGTYLVNLIIERNISAQITLKLR
jgi:hypothetical protein